MSQYLARRVMQFVPVAFAVSVVIFVLLRVLPGDVARLLLMGPQGGGVADPEQIERLRAEMGLNLPLYQQYLNWVQDLVRLDLGKSYWSGEPIAAIVARTFPVTLQLAVLTAVIAMIIALPVGIISAIRQDTWMDYAFRVVTVAGMTLPTFWTGTLAVLALVLLFRWSPPIEFTNLWEDPVRSMEQFIWPVLVLGYWFAAPLSRMARSSMLEILRQDYIRTAWSKGLRERSVVFRHALKNAVLPVVTLAGVQVGRMLGGSVVVESIFGLPGMGRALVDGVIYHEYLLVQAIVLLIALIFMTSTLSIDILYAWLDPRIRYR